MISTHCGQRLTYLRGDRWGYKVSCHHWLCKVCGKTFKQHTRQALKEEQMLQEGREALVRLLCTR